jgi:peroxiredoxin
MRFTLNAPLAGLLLAFLVGFGLAPAAAQQSAPLAGRWDATVIVNGIEIPCAFEITGTGAAMTGAFFNSSLRIVSTGTTIQSGTITFAYDQYGTKLQVAEKDGALEGEYQRARGGYPFHAVRARSAAAPAANVPSIDGVWIVKARGSKNEEAWRFVVNQKGADVEATILRIDGDTGALTGRYDGSRFVLSHFDGSRPLLMEVTKNADGTLKLVENKRTESTAVRADTAEAKAIGAPEDPTYHTTVRDPNEPFRFSFPDLNGKIVSNTDPKFKGKVVLVSISGSWCPNCHDEAPFHAALYKKYRDQGFEVVSLSFERADQLKDPVQLRAFIKTYGIEYTVLIPGEPDQASELLPQTVNLDCFPTSFLLGRDGRVRMVHAGFPSPGSGQFYDEAVKGVTGKVEALLAEKP